MNETTTTLLHHMKQILENAQENLRHAQSKAVRQANKTCRAEEFEEGDKVLLSTKNLRNFEIHLRVKL